MEQTELEMRSALLKTMREKNYSFNTHYKITQHIGSKGKLPMAEKAIKIVENAKTEAEALEQILNL